MENPRQVFLGLFVKRVAGFFPTLPEVPSRVLGRFATISVAVKMLLVGFLHFLLQECSFGGPVRDLFFAHGRLA